MYHKVDGFIYQSYLDDISVCDELIEYHKSSDEKREGRLGKYTVDLDSKKSTDVELKDSLIAKKYLIELSKIVNRYKTIFEYCNDHSFWKIIEVPNIQHYKANEAFKIWHAERTSSIFPTCTRHLVFMTYLNDIDDGGETEFYYQKLKISPKKGLTVIWPADWTHTHRGIVSKTQEKYIITGWFNYVEENLDEQ